MIIKDGVVIWGTGNATDKVVQYMCKKRIPILYFVDSNPNKWGEYYDDKLIKRPIELIKEPRSVVIIIASDKYFFEIQTQLVDLGIYYRNKCIRFEEFVVGIEKTLHKVKPISLTKANNTIISILYDPQIFSDRNNGGISRYFYENITRIATKKDTAVTFFEGIHDSDYRFEKHKKNYCNYYGQRNHYLSFQQRGALNAKLFCNYVALKECFDIYHPTYYREYGILNYNKMVLTVHDMIHEIFFPESFEVKRKENLIHKADMIVAVSENTKKDLINILGVDEKKIRVIYEGNSLNYKVDDEPVIPSDYVLYVGSRNAYKNANLLISAFAKSKIHRDILLVFVGGGNFTDAEKELIHELKIENSVMHIDADDETLANLYNYAKFFVYPSKYEGFGIPILEAMHYKTPVITSDASSTKEVAGDAAMLFDADSEESLIYSLEKMAGDSVIRKHYIEKGIIREKDFSWDKCADEIYRLYKEVQGY